MYILKTIEEVVAYHLRRLRGDRTQSEMAELLSLPLRTYQHLESGSVPRPETRKIISERLGIGETELFIDPDMIRPDPGAAVAVLAEFVKKHST